MELRPPVPRRTRGLRCPDPRSRQDRPPNHASIRHVPTVVPDDLRDRRSNTRDEWLAPGAAEGGRFVAPRLRRHLQLTAEGRAPTQVDLPPGNGRGIHLFRVDRATGALTAAGVHEVGTSPSCLALNAAGTRLYSANETDRRGTGRRARSPPSRSTGATGR
ncbi:MAG TPA: beta-propeller fold lactonase family protein [Gemmataceae bacterium]|nr:beta-propeller fold lactonase family protein [Gemmataceae bacterium]